jgi:hypothetical protein
MTDQQPTDKSKSSFSMTSSMVAVLGMLGFLTFEAYQGAKFCEFGIPGVFVSKISCPSTESRMPEATRDFFVGRWQVDQKIGNSTGATSVDYLSDGTFAGYQTQFTDGSGKREDIHGTWVFRRLDKEKFHLDTTFDDGRTWSGDFDVVDANRVHNFDTNYIAIRLAQ